MQFMDYSSKHNLDKYNDCDQKGVHANRSRKEYQGYQLLFVQKWPVFGRKNDFGP